MPSLARVASTKLQCALSVSRSLPLRTLGYSLRSIATAPGNAKILQHPAYVPIADLAGRPRVLLLGDSISIGYTLPVRRELRGIANLHRPAANCTHSRNGVRHLAVWLGEVKWDVIHCNFGLHDCVRDGDELAIPLAEYRRNLEEIFCRLWETGARLAWASTTPVRDHLRYHDAATGQWLQYREADVHAYNEAAALIAQQHGAAIDALDDAVRQRLDVLQLPGDIHFTKAGYKVLGQQVADFPTANAGLGILRLSKGPAVHLHCQRNSRSLHCAALRFGIPILWDESTTHYS